MKRIRWIALVLAVTLLFTGCSGMSFTDLMGNLGAQIITPFSEMHYLRPDIAKMEESLDTVCKVAEKSDNKDALMKYIWEFYDLYNSYFTKYNLACIHYFKDMTDYYWEKEYNFCAQNAGKVEAMLDEMFYALAASPMKDALERDVAFGEGFFDSYVGGESIWDEKFVELMEQEAMLEEQYYDLCEKAQAVEYYSDPYFAEYGTQMAEVFVKLVALRQNIAEYVGYDSYMDFAYSFYHYRDYSPQQAEAYLKDIQKELVPLYRKAGGMDGASDEWEGCTQEDAFTYAESMAMAMGGTVKEAFQVMRQAGLYDLTYSEKKYNGSFEVYLPEYGVPFVFVSPSATQRDKLSFVHEFGHFCNDYASYGSAVSVDVAEVFSQGMEYLSLCYGDGAGALTQMKMVDCLRIFVEQAAYATFEQEVYRLSDDELTPENVFALYEEIGTDFGFDTWDWDSRDFVVIGHFFTDPFYIVSYVVSNDAALQLYQMEQKEPNTGLALYNKELNTQQTYFIAFLEEAGLESPFAPGRVKAVRLTLEAVLG